ncbi:MAG: PKD domain-containing protein [Sedimentisphaerales bacterium]|nr:PKD domain-containing protein [Sedimentisphaerales bacterium]
MNRRNKFQKLAVLTIALILAAAAQAALIGSVTSRNGDAGTSPALGGILTDPALAWVDRNNHRLEGIPATLVDQAEYIKSVMGDKDNAGLEYDVVLTSTADVYLFIDNRVGDGVNTNPPTLTTKMTWIATMGFVDTGLEISIDEDFATKDGIDNYYRLYKATFPAGTLTLSEQNDGGTRAMYILAALPGNPAAGDPDPYDGEVRVALNKVLTWTAPTNADIDPAVPIEYSVYVDPNETKVSTGTGCTYFQNFSTSTSFDPNPDLTLNEQYYWRVDVKCRLVDDPNEYTYPGKIWTFKAVGPTPDVTAGQNVLTSLDLVPATLSGNVSDLDNDTQAITWTILTDDSAYPGSPVKEVMQMQGRNAYTADPTYTGLLQDWIGTDTREKGDPLTLTLSGLPAGTYTWTSYHHDTQDQTGLFDLTIDGVPYAGNPVDISHGADLPFDPNVTKVVATMVSDGSDVKLVFDQQPYGTTVANAFFVMNGFSLVSETLDPDLFVDFGGVATPVQTEYTAYTAGNEVLADFPEKSFAAFGSTVTVNPDWGYLVNAVVTDTTSNWQTPTGSFTTDTAGTYKVRLTATDDDGSDSEIMEVRVYADACAAAKASPAGYTKPAYDFNNDCIENLLDFAAFAGKWLEDLRLSAQDTFISNVTYDEVIQP